MMLSRHYRDLNVRTSAWTSSTSEKNETRHNGPATPTKSSIGKRITKTNDRCCTVCAGGLFLPRQMTDSCNDDYLASNSLSIALPSTPIRVSAGNSKDDDTPKRSLASAPSWSSSRRIEKFELQRQSSCCGDTDMPEVARFRQEELILGKRYGKGGSASVYEITGFSAVVALQEDQQQDAFTAIVQQDSSEATEAQWEDPGHQRVLHEAVTGAFPNTDRYVVKWLSSKIRAALPNDKHARACAINLVLEANVLRMVDHPNIIKLHGMSAPHDEAPFLLLTCLPESMEQRILHWRQQVCKLKKNVNTSNNGGSMWRMVSSKGGSSKQAYGSHTKLRKLLWERIHVGRDIALAVDHLHSKGILYRDIKCSNIGFDSSGVVKIFDFGISRFLPRCASQQNSNEAVVEDSIVMGKAGTKLYMSPEVMCDLAFHSVADLYKTDVYSFGVLLWQLLSMSTPEPLIADLYNSARKETVRVDQFPLFHFPMCPCWPMELQDLVQQLMKVDCKARPTMEETHVALTAQLEKLKRAIKQHDVAPVVSSSTSKNKQRLFGRQRTFEGSFGGSIDLDMP
jgi:serine/threonine protein kinase